MVKKVFIDTNVWLRFLLRDQEKQSRWSYRLIESVEEGKIRPYTSAIVLLELHYVLSKVYQVAPDKVQKIIKDILSTRNLVVVNKTDFKKAFLWQQKYQLKLSDCLIASNFPPNCALVTWDKEMTKLKFLQVISPEKLQTR